MKRIWLLLLIIAMMLTGCYQKGTVMDTNLFEPYRIADANIPFADNLHAAQFDRVVEMETDDYGRRYFLYTTYSVMLASDVEIHIISQMTRGDEVFYYPDLCYLVKAENAAFTEEDILQLKISNDWNCPLEEDKMYTTSYSQYHKDVANETEMGSAIASYLDIDDSYGVLYNGLETSNGNEQLLVVRVFPREKGDESTDAGKFYLMIYKDGLHQPITMCQQVSDWLLCQEQIPLVRAAWLQESSKE